MGKKVILSCKECGSRNYSTTGSKRPERLSVKKFCKVCGTHTIHCETK